MKQVTSRILITACAAALAVATSGTALAQTEGNAIHTQEAGDLLTELTALSTTTKARAHDGAPAQLEGNTLRSAPDFGVALNSTVNHGWIAPLQDHTVHTSIGRRSLDFVADTPAFPRVQM